MCALKIYIGRVLRGLDDLTKVGRSLPFDRDEEGGSLLMDRDIGAGLGEDSAGVGPPRKFRSCQAFSGFSASLGMQKSIRVAIVVWPAGPAGGGATSQTKSLAFWLA